MSTIPERPIAEQFYDAEVGQRLADYKYGNPRVSAAIAHTLRWIPPYATNILDIGCGIGHSTYEIKRNFPAARAVGVDLSERAISIAARLFGGDGIEFRAEDVTEWADSPNLKFDAVVMLDVYEHIPRTQRDKLHALLNRVLAGSGVLILTFPSVLHQRVLRERQPSDLQPVDEDVSISDVARIAAEIGGVVIDYRHVNTWHSNDYVHTAIARQPAFVRVENSISNGETKAAQDQRGEHVSTTLGTNVTREGLLLHDNEGPTVCIARPNKSAYSERFIRAHIERLPGRVKTLYGRDPFYTEDGVALLPPPGMAHKVKRLIQRKLGGKSPRDFLTDRIGRFLVDGRIDIVLAEYGPTGVALVDACQRSKVPLAVYFHGFDAYDHQTLDQYGAAYRPMFAMVSAVIVVSRDMEQQLRDLGAPADRVHYIPYGADTDLFAGGDPGSAPSTFLAVGRFVDKKAPQLTLLAFKKVLETCPDSRLIMIGDGELWECCKRLVTALGISGAVELRGARSHTEVAAAMRGARAFVQHSVTASYGDSEGTPATVIEAGAVGLPVVSTRHAGIKDVVVHPDTGLLVDEGDVDGMAEHMILLARDAELAAKMGKQARARICASFTLEGSIERLWQVLVASKRG